MLPLRHVGDASPIIKLPCKQTNEILYQSDHVPSLSLPVALSLFLGHALVAEAWCNLGVNAHLGTCNSLHHTPKTNTRGQQRIYVL